MGLRDIPKYGLTETVYATLFARFGELSPIYIRMLGGQQPPRHFVQFAERLKKERPWEKERVLKPPGAKLETGAPRPKIDWWGEIAKKAAGASVAPKPVDDPNWMQKFAPPPKIPTVADDRSWWSKVMPAAPKPVKPQEEDDPNWWDRILKPAAAAPTVDDDGLQGAWEDK